MQSLSIRMKCPDEVSCLRLVKTYIPEYVMQILLDIIIDNAEVFNNY